MEKRCNNSVTNNVTNRINKERKLTIMDYHEVERTVTSLTTIAGQLRNESLFKKHTDKELVDIAVRLLLNDQLTSEVSGVRNALRFMNDPRYN